MMNRQEFRDFAFRQIVRLDGATGTELSKRGLPPGVCPEEWICRHPEALHDLHRAYRAAGSDILYVPTFGGNEKKLAAFSLAEQMTEINTRIVQIARQAETGAMLFGDLAPLGELLYPAGTLDFEECVSVFRRQAAALAAAGVDGFAIETMMDLNETRAALIAVREVSETLPVIVSLTVDSSGKTLTGCDAVAALAALQELGADAFGCNCSSGPREMAPVIARLKPYAKIPLMAKPNAGMPHLDAATGETRFDLAPKEFAEAMHALIDAGASLIGGCCGTTPDHIAALTRATAGRKPEKISPLSGVLSSSSRIVRPVCAGKTLLIGERINPTGKKALQAELREGKLDLVRQFAREQEAAGADLLDVNFGLAGIDETALMKQAIPLLVTCSTLPLCIDTTDAATAEAALRLYPGRALFNSISAETSRLEEVLPVVKKYGALPILLPLTDQGIPQTLAERKNVLQTLLDALRRIGMDPAEAMADLLIMTMGADPQAPRSALEFLDHCTKELSLPTVCGLSNVSFGLPGRAEINRSFLALAQSRGLTAAIANPGAPGIIDQLTAGNALLGYDENLAACLRRFSAPQETLPAEKAPEMSVEKRIFQAIETGEKSHLPALLQEAADKGDSPDFLLETCLIPALTSVGDRFGRKELFLPQLMQSAGAMQSAMEVLEPLLSTRKTASGPVIVFATVEGDIHDIGKNIVILLLKNRGFQVVDLGKDVPAAAIVKAVREHHASLVALSALMTTTMPKMKECIALLKEEGLSLPVMVGGAAVDELFAASIGAFYSTDAAAAVALAVRLTEKKQ